MTNRALHPGDDIDATVDAEIAACLTKSKLRSFFLFAGAGSGKTRSLVTALEHIRDQLKADLISKGHRVAVITFTNAACDEIKSRLKFDQFIEVSTIHSFAWSLIEGLTEDTRRWLQVKLVADIAKLEDEQKRGRKGKASETRVKKIEAKQKRLANLPSIRKFTYSPTGENNRRDSLNHAEVIQLSAHLLAAKPAMQNILVGRFPILLIDESQDTNHQLLDALFAVQAAHPGRFALGLLGDMMQRIYNDGKEGLGHGLPDDWARPNNKLNYRCPSRVIDLINRVRQDVDGQQQVPLQDAPRGTVRMYLAADDADRAATEQTVREQMVAATDDGNWLVPSSVKTLILEHRMAAVRMGFLDLFAPLYSIDSWRTGLLEGTLPMLSFFTRQVSPLIEASGRGDRFGVMRLLRSMSPRLYPGALRAQGDQRVALREIADSVDELVALWEAGRDPTLREILKVVVASHLLEVPERLLPFATTGELSGEAEDANVEDDVSERDTAIDAFLSAPYSQLERYVHYRSGQAAFDTHQGVKGLEFDRVMVVMDDHSARGFLFKYEDLFGGKPQGDKTVEATRRLFYVTCSRAKKSLALVAYSKTPRRIREFLVNQGWFEDSEVVLL